MKFRLLLIIFLISSCSQNFTSNKSKTSFTSEGFAYIFSENDFDNRVIKKRLDNNLLQIAHNKLRVGTSIKLINPITKDSIILKNKKNINFPKFYKIMITEPVATELNLRKDLPIIELIEIKKNKSFIAKKTETHNEEKNIHSNAPVESVKIDNISKNKNIKKKKTKNDFNIIIAEFYSKESAILFESNTYQNLDKIIVIQSPLKLRIERVKKRDGRSKNDIKKIIKNQMKESDYIQYANYVINNDHELLLPKIIQLNKKLSHL